MALNINEKIKNMLFKNSYSESTTDGYSANYLNNLLETSAIQSKVKQLITSDDYGSGTITLNDDIRNYDYLIIQTGKVGNNTYSAQVCFPFGPRLLTGWIIGDTLNGKTINGNFKLNVTSFTELSIASADDHIRCIFGGKF